MNTAMRWVENHCRGIKAQRASTRKPTFLRVLLYLHLSSGLHRENRRVRRVLLALLVFAVATTARPEPPKQEGQPASSRVPVTAGDSDLFPLKEFWIDKEPPKSPRGHEFPQGTSILQCATLRFTLSPNNRAALGVKKLLLRVHGTEARRLASFPYYGEGAPPTPEASGYVVIKPQPDVYAITLWKPSQVGRTVAPGAFAIAVFCEEGYIYKAQIELQWVDLKNKRREGRAVLNPTFTLDFPRIEAWTKLAQGAKSLKVLHYRMVGNLLSRIDETPTLKSIPSVAILVADRHVYHADGDRFVLLPESEHPHLVMLVGDRFFQSRPANFIIVDGTKLLLQTEDDLSRAEIIADPARVAPIETLFDELFERYSSRGEEPP